MEWVGRKFQLILYFINGIIFVLAAIIIAFSYLAIDDKVSIGFPSWTFLIALIFGIILAVFSLIGFYGAYKAHDRCENNQRHWFLYIYFFILLITIILQLTAGAVILSYNSDLNLSKDVTGARDQTQELIIEQIKEQAQAWKDIQNSLKCCGWNDTTTDLATGDCCLEDIDPDRPEDCVGVCKDLVLDMMISYGYIVSVICIVVAIIEIIALISTIRLCTYKIQPVVED